VGTIRWGRILVAVLLLASAPRAIAQEQTVGLFVNDERAFRGYTLFGPAHNTTVYLINNDGLLVHRWVTDQRPNLMGYLRENGNLVRPARFSDAESPGIGGQIQEYDWDGNLVWEYFLDGDVYLQHHDIALLPNGNVLLIVQEQKTRDDAIATGRNPSTVGDAVTPDAILEVRPIPPAGGEIVWEWHVWDHMIQNFDPTRDNYGMVAAHPELIDVNYGSTMADWNHANGIDYNPQLDQIVISPRTFDEFWVIDHSTTSEEAAGHTGGNSGMGGDILYRWGNPLAYRRGSFADQRLYSQHDAQWIPPGRPGAGNILVYNNGYARLGTDYSSVDEIVPPVDENGHYTIEAGEAFGPREPVWSYVGSPPSSFFSPLISGAERQPNGNTLICEGTSGHLFEVTQDREVVWDYVNPISDVGAIAQGAPPDNNTVFKTRRYAPDHPAFAGRTLLPGDPLEDFVPPRPVPPGSLVAARLTGSGDLIDVNWDASTCSSFAHNLVFGDLAQVSTLDLLGEECDIGMAGTFTWAAPAGSLYFLVVGTDAIGIYESSWGQHSSGAERSGTRASFRCGTTTKVVSSSCP